MLPHIATELESIAEAMERTRDGERSRTGLWTFVSFSLSTIGPQVDTPPGYDAARDALNDAVEHYTGGKTPLIPSMRSAAADAQAFEAMKRALAAYSAILENAGPGYL